MLPGLEFSHSSHAFYELVPCSGQRSPALYGLLTIIHTSFRFKSVQERVLSSFSLYFTVNELQGPTRKQRSEQPVFSPLEVRGTVSITGDLEIKGKNGQFHTRTFGTASVTYPGYFIHAGRMDLFWFMVSEGSYHHDRWFQQSRIVYTGSRQRKCQCLPSFLSLLLPFSSPQPTK